LRFAVPDRICADLGAHLFNPPLAAAQAEYLLEQLRASSLLLIALDAEDRWFRFHHLFRDLLLRRLQLQHGTVEVHALQVRTAAWFAAADLHEEALRYYVAADATEQAATLVETQLRRERAQSGSNQRLMLWLRRLPAQLIAQRPGLTFFAAHIAAVNLDLLALEAGLAQIDALLAAAPSADYPWPSFAADLLILRGINACWRGQSAVAVELLTAGLTQGVLHTLIGRAQIILGLALVGQGSYAAGIAHFTPANAPDRAVPSPEHALYQCASRVAMHILAGEMRALTDEATTITALRTLYPPSETLNAYLSFCLGTAAYEQNDLATAATCFRAVIALKYRINHTTYINGIVGLALTAAAQGSEQEADVALQTAFSFAQETGGAFFLHQALGAQVRVALLQRHPQVALQSAERIGTDIHPGASPWIEAPLLSKAAALLASGGADQQAAAMALLATYRTQVAALHNIRLLVRTVALQALGYAAQGDLAAAQHELTIAVTLAAPRNLLRSLIDLGPTLHPLLRSLTLDADAAAYRAAVLAHQPERTSAEPVSIASSATLPEMLTRRELEILGLLADRWTDKEIAAQLVIAPNTVRKHTSTIYDKLGVHNRRDAVALARTLGLLTEAV
jgi:LuxR family maltose regulon positive regulatory protein